jgi:hypothetical protein
MGGNEHSGQPDLSELSEARIYRYSGFQLL